MFEWLVEEMKRVKTRKFYLVDGPASPQLRKAVEAAAVPVPPSYKEFVLRFGNAKLYRKLGYYLVEVLAAPREVEDEAGRSLLYFGAAFMSSAYFDQSLLVADEESPIFESRYRQGLRKAADGFEEWLKKRCTRARRSYKKNEWQAIEKGPPPFSDQEIEVVNARRKYRWRVVGTAPNGDLQFEVHNGSNLTLPYLSVGIRAKLRPPDGGPLEGGVWLPVQTVGPGETRVIAFDCYKDLADPSDIEAFPQPDPGPEDRERYWEFRALDK